MKSIGVPGAVSSRPVATRERLVAYHERGGASSATLGIPRLAVALAARVVEVVILNAVVDLPGLRNCPGAVKPVAERGEVDVGARAAGGGSDDAAHRVAQVIGVAEVKA